ncbi:MAG: DUF3307 domain-containing protein [Erysipelotrichia bacterium]|jgi:hypothetical protein|nr:DUF3307 domain-containing protein [Erysipelotrichia bacterium]
MIFKILLIIHLFADFNLQNKDSVQRKETEVLTFSNLIKSEHIKHSLIHAFIFFGEGDADKNLDTNNLTFFGFH